MEEEENQEVLKTDAEIVLIFNRKKLYATKYVKKCCKLYFSVVEAGSLWYSPIFDSWKVKKWLQPQ